MGQRRREAVRCDAGYASLTAIVLCAALSLICAGTLGLVTAQKRQAQRALFRSQQLEAFNTAILRFSSEVVRAQGDDSLNGVETVDVPGGHMTVTLRAEYEGRKWPLGKIADVDETVLRHYTPLSRSALQSIPSSGDNALRNDCLRSLFSPYGMMDTTHDLPKGTSLIAMSGGHDGQVWRLRAVTGNRVEERLVRFLGDPSHLFAVVSQEDYALGEMPTCTTMKQTP